MEKNVMKALVGAIQKFSTEDGPGIRTTVFLKGCPLHCRWCHNPELISYKQQIIEMPNSCIHCGYCLEHCPEKAIYVGEDKKIHVDKKLCNVCLACSKFCYARALQAVAREMSSLDIMKEVVQDKGFYDETGGGMTISGGEVLSQSDFAKELIRLAAGEGINVCLDTSGFGDSDKLYELSSMANVSHILYDMKAINDEVHKAYTGQSNELILSNLIRLAGEEKTREKIQMRMPLIHDVNDTWPIIEKTAAFYQQHGLKKVTLLPYHSLGISKIRNLGNKPTEFVTPSEEYVYKIKKYFEDEAGMSVEWRPVGARND